MVRFFVLLRQSKIKKKKLQYLLFLFLSHYLLFSRPKSAQSIGVSAIHRFALENHSLAPRHVHKYHYARTVNRRLDKIIMAATYQTILLIYINEQYSYINEKLLKKLKASNIPANLTLLAIGLIIYVMFQGSGIEIVSKLLETIQAWNTPTVSPRSVFSILSNSTPGFFTPVASSSIEIAVIPTQAQEFNDMLLEFNEPKPSYNFVISQEEALERINSTYPGKLQISANKQFSDIQAAKKIYHSIDFDINPED